MGCICQGMSKVSSRGMNYLVPTALPEKTPGDVVYLPLICNIDSSSIFAIVLSEFFSGKSPHFGNSPE